MLPFTFFLKNYNRKNFERASFTLKNLVIKCTRENLESTRINVKKTKF